MAGHLQETPHHARVGELPVPELEGWGYFEDGEELVWKVRNATAAEWARASEAPERQAKLMEVAMKLVAGGDASAEQFRELLNIDAESTPAEVSKGIQLITFVSISPEIGPDNRHKIVELSETHPLIFFQLKKKIDEISGQGAVLGKPKRSGKKRKSKTS